MRKIGLLRDLPVTENWKLKIVLLFLVLTFAASSAWAGSLVNDSTSEYIMIIRVIKTTMPKHRIEKITIQPGILSRQNNSLASHRESLNNPRLVVLDQKGNVLYKMEFNYPKLITVPPLPPGYHDDEEVPSVVPIEKPEVSLVVPYFPNAVSVQIIDTGEEIPSASYLIQDAEFEKKQMKNII